MHAAFRPKVVFPLTLSAGLLVALFNFGNVHDILAEISSFQLTDLIWYMGLFVIYEFGRWLQWHFLVGSLGVRVSTRHQLLSFLTGEVSKNLPFGNYFPNYVLKQAAGADFGFTSSITTAIVLFEVAVTLLGVVILGLTSWNAWLRPLILIGTPAFIVCIWIVYKWRAGAGAPHWMYRYKPLRNLLAELKQFRDGASNLWHPRTIILGLVICAAYISAAGGTLFVITRGLHVHTLSWPQVLAVYCFSLAFALIEPSPVDLGVTELGGVGAFLAVGLGRDTAITAMLMNRVFSIGASLVIVAVGLFALHRELRIVLSSGSESPRDTLELDALERDDIEKAPAKS